MPRTSAARPAGNRPSSPKSVWSHSKQAYAATSSSAVVPSSTICMTKRSSLVCSSLRTCCDETSSAMTCCKLICGRIRSAQLLIYKRADVKRNWNNPPTTAPSTESRADRASGLRGEAVGQVTRHCRVSLQVPRISDVISHHRRPLLDGRVPNQRRKSARSGSKAYTTHTAATATARIAARRRASCIKHRPANQPIRLVDDRAAQPRIR